MIENIRNAKFQDIPYLYEIALKTGNAGSDATSLFNNPYTVGYYYSTPYIHFEPQLCFVALDSNQEPSGYIVATSDTVLYNSWFNTNWLPPLKTMYKLATPKTDEEERIIKQIMKGQGQGLWEHSGYPAHLHINLLPKLQGKGLGRGLIESLLTKLSDMKVKGVHLGVDGKNKNAIGFYKALGFEILEETQWGYYMGKVIWA